MGGMAVRVCDGRGDEDRTPARRRFAGLICVVVVGAVSLLPSSVSASPPAGPAPGVDEGEFARGVDRLRDLGARRATAEARRQRQESGLAHAELTNSDAVALARRLAREVVAGPERVIPGRAVRFFGDHAAQVDGANGERMLVESTLPLRTSSGEPADLALTESLDGFAPRSAIVPVTIGARPADGAWLEDSGFGLVPVVPAGSRRGHKVGGAAVWPNALQDTDLAVRMRPDGFETFAILRSAAAPSEFEYRVRLPRGGRVEQVEGGGLRVLVGDRVVAMVGAPVAHDADGWPVPVTQTLVGDRLRLSVDVAAADPRFPVTVDPTVTSTYDWRTACGSSTPFSHWTFGTSGNPYFSPFQGSAYLGCGNYIRDNVGHSYTGNQNAWFRYQVPGNGTEAQLTSFVSNGYLDMLASADMCIVWGIARVGSWSAGPQTDCTGPGNKSTSLTSTTGRWAYWQVWAHSTGTRKYNAYQGYARVGVTDNTAPQSTSFPAVGWTRDDGAPVTAAFSDGGVGIQSGRLWAPAQTGWTGERTITPSSCTRIPCTSSASLAGTVANLPDGDNQINAQATDAAGNARNVTTSVKVDRTVPDVRYSGRLASLDGRGVDQDVKLEISATDGSATNSRAGVRDVSIWVDDALVDSKVNPECAQSCSLDHSYTFSPALYSAGEHTVRVEVSDWAGNIARQSWYVTSAAGTVPTLQEGQRTGRRLVLRAQRSRGGATGVRFQYRRTTGETWRDIHVSALRTRRGDAVGDWPVGLDDQGRSETLVWDLPATPGLADAGGRVPDGPVHVRGVFSDSPATVTEDVHTTLVSSGIGTDDAVEQIGPVNVDLLTGNARLEAPDVSIDAYKTDLTVTRVHDSRGSMAGGFEPLGPGWTLNALPDDGGASFTSIVNMAEVETGAYYALAKTSSGDEIAFEEDGTGHTYIAELGFEEFKLTRHMIAGRIDRYTLLEEATGNTLTFVPSGVNGEYLLSRVDQPGSGEQLSASYEPVPGGQGKRIVRLLAPAPPGVTCSSQLVRGCRALEFDYATTTGGGDYAGRLSAVRLRAWDPRTAQMVDMPVARYEYDAAGRLAASYDPRISPALKERYTYDDKGRLASYTPPGELAWSFEYEPAPGDPDGGRLHRVHRPTLPPQSGTATTTIVYGVLVAGAEAPRDMSAANLDAVGQQDLPVDATAVFRADTPVGDYNRATIHYLNGDGRTVNTALPGDRLVTTEHDARGNVIRELTPANRQRALALGSTAARAAKAIELSTLRIWAVTDAGPRITEELGPMHLVRTSSGSEARGREQTLYTYDEGRPDAKDYNLPTTTRTRALLADGTTADERVSQTTYDFRYRVPTSTTIEGTGQTSKTVYDAQGLAIEQRTPRDPDGTAASTVQTVRYSAAANAVAACGNRPEWAGLPCVERPAAQPATGAGRYELLTTRFEYDLLENVTLEEETSGVATRSTTREYDAAGREIRQSVVASAGAAMPRLDWEHDTATGEVTTTRSTLGGEVQTIRVTYDALGRETEYRDAHGDVTSTEYDILDRPVVVRNGGGTRTIVYANGTDAVSELHDSDLGWINAQYDADGNLVSQELSASGLKIETSFDEVGQLVKRRYAKQTLCGSGCEWFVSEKVNSVHSQMLRHADSTGTQLYAYDAGGRLVRADDRTSGTSCVRRSYEYDANSNRVAQRSYPAADVCGSTAPLVVTHTYDAADRLVDPDYAYDPFGRTTRVPGQDAGGAALDLTYFANDQVRSMSQGNKGYTYSLDPGRRNAVRTPHGGQPEIVHYGDDSDEPTWTERAGALATRDITDIADELIAVRRGGQVTLQLTNLHGDVVAEVPNRHDAPAPAEIARTDEFGVPETASAQQIEVVGASEARYGWLGAHQRATELPSGVINMGVRVYLPQIGRFLQPDPVVGGSANPYDYAFQDPLNQYDLDGALCVWCPVAVAVLVRAARASSKASGRAATRTARTAKRASGVISRAAARNAVKLYSIAKRALKRVARAAYDFAQHHPVGQQLFRKGGTKKSGVKAGVLNRNPAFRIGLGWKAQGKGTGRLVFRVAIFKKKSRWHRHWDLYDPGPPKKK